MFRTLGVYLASLFILPFLLSTVFFVSFMLIFQLFRIIDLIVAKHVPLDVVVNLLFNISVSYLTYTIPLSILFSVIYVLGRLSDDSEIVAMRSFGVSKYKLFSPLLILGIFISGVVYSLGQEIVPQSNLAFKKVLASVSSAGILSEIKAGHFYLGIPKVTLFAEGREKDGKLLKNLFLNIQSKDREQIVFAQEGHFFEEGPSNDLRLKLINGNILELKEKKIQKSLFHEYEFPVITSASKDETFGSKVSTMTNNDLHAAMELKKKNGGNALTYRKEEIELWSRYQNVVQCLLFMFVGFSLGLKKGRGKEKGAGGPALLVLLTYYSLFFFGVSLLKKGFLPVGPVLILPAVLIFLLAVYLFSRLDWSR